MAVFVAVLLAVGMLGAVVGTRRAPTLTRAPQRGQAAPAPAARGLALAAVPGAADRLRDPGAGHRRACSPASRTTPSGCCSGRHRRRCCSPPSSGRRSCVMPLWVRVGRRLGKRDGLLIASALFVVGRGRPGAAVAPAAPAWSSSLVGARRRRLRRHADVPAVDAARRDRRRRGGVPARAGPASSPASGPRPRRSASPSGPGLLGGLLALAGYVSGGAEVPPAGLGGHRRSGSGSACSRRCSCWPACRCSPATGSTPTRSTEPRMTPAGRPRPS